MIKQLSRPLSMLATLVALTPMSVFAQDGGYTWTNATELSFVSSGGNASSSTLGLKAALTGANEVNRVKLEVGGVRGETTFRTLTATGTATSFSVNESTNSELTAENYFARARYDRSFGTPYAFAGAGWGRNTFAGVQNRYSLVSGLGNTWTDGDTGRFKTDVGLTYTIQRDVDPEPGKDEGFGGIRLSVDAMRQLSETAQFSSVLELDENLENTNDLRADWINSLAVTLSERLALKTSLQVLFDNQPSLLEIPLLDGGGNPIDNVLTAGDKTDRILTLTLVITL